MVLPPRHGSANNGFPQSSDHESFINILKLILSFRSEVELNIFTLNIDSITNSPINIAELEGISQLSTTLYITFNDNYTSYIALYTTGT